MESPEQKQMIRYRYLVAMERLMALELFKRQARVKASDFMAALQGFRAEIKKCCSDMACEAWPSEVEDYADTALDCLQFGKDHGLDMMNAFSDEDAREHYERFIIKLCLKFRERHGDRFDELKKHPLAKSDFRWSELSHENDIPAVCRWWIEAARTEVSWYEMPCRVPRVKLRTGTDYDILFQDNASNGCGFENEVIDIHLRLGRDVDCDRMLLNFIRQLRLHWSIRELVLLKEGMLPAERQDSLVLDSEEIINRLEKKLFARAKKETEIEPFLLGLMCWDAKCSGLSVSSATSQVVKFRQTCAHAKPEESLFALVKRGYLKLRKAIKDGPERVV